MTPRPDFNNDSDDADRAGKGLPLRTLGAWLRWLAILGVVAWFVFASFSPPNPAQALSYSEVLDRAQAGEVAEIDWNNVDGTITGILTDEAGGGEFVSTGPLQPPEEDLAIFRDNGAEVRFATPQGSWIGGLLITLLPLGLIIFYFWWIGRRAPGQMSELTQVGRSQAKTYTTDRPDTSFSDVAGYQGVKQEIREVVDYLKHPERFTRIGARAPKGLLLVGPPGTGKTLLARAVAGEARVPFLCVTGSDFMEVFVGIGAKRVRDLFAKAKGLGRAIIFIDEIDAVGRQRGPGLGSGHDEREQTLNQMLSEMDGFEESKGVVVIAATNRPDVLDPALLRPGRFDRQIEVPLPDLQERIAILRVHARRVQLDSEVDLAAVARSTPGMSGADLANLVNEAALFAVRGGEESITMRNFDQARDRVLMGISRETLVLSGREKETTAYHEAGHALIATQVPHADPLHKVTILPVGRALGVTQQLPEEDKHGYDQHYLEDRLCIALGGRVAEDLIFGVLSTGASSDLISATTLARKMVREWGMSSRLGPMAWGSAGRAFLGDDLMMADEYSDDTARIIDEEVERILREQEKRCRYLIETHRRALDRVAQALIDQETVDGAEVRRIVEQAMAAPVAAPVAALAAG